MNNIKYRILLVLYKKKFSRKIFYRYINKLDGGEFNSQVLRKIFSDNYSISVGTASYGCFKPDINFGVPIKFGNYCSIAANVHFIPGNHPITDVSTHPYFHRPEYGYISFSSGGGNITPTNVGHDVWIGRDAIILPKCKTIGNGAIIGAGSVVTHDVEPYSIVAGNPAIEIRKRFDNRSIELLENSKWYNFSPQELKNAFKYAKDIDKFIEEIGNIKES